MKDRKKIIDELAELMKGCRKRIDNHVCGVDVGYKKNRFCDNCNEKIEAKINELKGAEQ
jgi:hypothetical protein